MTRRKRAVACKKPICNRFFVKFCSSAAALFVSLFFSVSGFTADASLSLRDAINRSMERHPELKAFVYQTQAQQGQATQAGLSAKPEVQLTIEDALGSGEYSSLDNALTTLSVSWILEDNIKRERINVASRGFDLINSEKTIKQFDIATQTSSYFLQALYLQEAMNIAARSIELAEQTVLELKKRVKLGIAPSAELYRAQAELSNRKMDLVDLKHEHLSALHQLAAQWGSSKPDFIVVTGSLDMISELQTFDALKQKLQDNPQFVNYHAREKIKQAELKLAQEQQSPRWQFSTGLRRYERTDDYGVVASFSIPFGGSNNNQGNIARANAELALNQAELDAFKTKLESKLFVEYQNYEHSMHVKELLAQEIIPKLEKALAETHKIYETGKYSYLDWLDVQNELLNAQSKLLNTQYKAHLNVLTIERLTGSVIRR